MHARTHTHTSTITNSHRPSRDFFNFTYRFAVCVSTSFGEGDVVTRGNFLGKYYKHLRELSNTFDQQDTNDTDMPQAMSTNYCEFVIECKTGLVAPNIHPYLVNLPKYCDGSGKQITYHHLHHLHMLLST